MAQFKNKIQDLRLGKLDEISPDNKNIRHVCSAQIKIRGHYSPSPRSELLNQAPIIICKKQPKQVKNKKQPKQVKVQKKVIKKIQPFVPIQVPISPRSKFDTKFKSLLQTQTSTPCGKKQIQIHIDQDTKDYKQCLKKLFKKVHKLTEDLAASQKQRIRLQLELDNLKNIDGFNRGQQKDLLKAEGQNYKLRSDVDFFKQLLNQKNNELAALKNKTPQQIIKQIVVQKPVQVRVEVPKYVPGPQKIVEVAKYVENRSLQKQSEFLRKKLNDLENELNLQKIRNAERHQPPQKDNIIPAIVQKPIYLEKPIYIEKPVYIQKPVYIEKPLQKQKIVQIPIQVPYEIPIYIDRPMVDDEVYLRLGELERQIQIYANQNEDLKRQIIQLRQMIGNLQTNIEILRRHNSEKNHQIEVLLKNTDDYNPIKMKQMIKKQTRIQGRNQTFRNAQIGTTFNPNL